MIEKKYNYTYQIKNLINGKLYIGVHSTNDLSDNYMGSGTILKKAILKYGEDNFEKIILGFYDTSKEAFDDEKYMVNESWVNSKNTYNCKIGGIGGDTYKYKREEDLNKIIEKISNKLKGNKNPFYGKKHSEESKKKISESLKNRIISDITKRKLSESNSGNKNPFYGKKHTEESKKKMSESSKGFIPHNKGKSKYDNIENDIIEFINNGFSNKDIMKIFNISKGGIYRIKQKIKNKE